MVHKTDIQGINNFVIPEINTRCSVAETVQAASDYVGSLKDSDFKGYNPLNQNADFGWIGREDLRGSGITKRREVAALVGDYVEADHKQIASARKQMSDLVDSIDFSSLKRMLKWSDNRGKVNALRLLNGDTRFRRTLTKSQAPAEAVALVVPTGGNCGVRAEIMFARTAVALAAAELLNDAGFVVEVWGYAYSRSCYRDEKNKNAIAAVMLKAADEPLNEAIAASAGSAWFFRSGIFGMWAAQGNASGGLGSSVELPKENRKYVAQAIGLEQAHVMRQGDGQRSVEDAIRVGIEDVKEAISKWTAKADGEGDY